MSDEEQTVLMVKGAIVERGEDGSKAAMAAYAEIRELEIKYGAMPAQLAIALRGA